MLLLAVLVVVGPGGEGHVAGDALVLEQDLWHGSVAAEEVLGEGVPGVVRGVAHLAVEHSFGHRLRHGDELLAAVGGWEELGGTAAGGGGRRRGGGSGTRDQVVCASIGLV